LELSILVLVGGVAVLGVFGQWLGWRFKVPAIIPLLLLGSLLGPVAGVLKPSVELGEVMRPAIGLAVAIIVFEGGLNLHLRELRSAGSGVMRLVALALPLNWLIGAWAGHYLGGFKWPTAILFGCILVVTGPTVIMPLLRQAKLAPRAAAFLKWEAIVNDPIGATLALLILSWLGEARVHGAGFATLVLSGTALIGVLLAATLGLLLPFGIRALFRHSLAPEYLKTPILLSGAIGVYIAGEAVQPETGLVGATLFGVVLANIEVTGLQELRRFKEALTVFLVSGLFILLTADIDPKVLRSISWPIVSTALFMVFVARPAAIWIATLGARMTWRERILVGWIGPRGVVAAAVAGVAADKLVHLGYPGAVNLLPMVFAVIALTVVLHGLSLTPLARSLGLASAAPPGLLIVGASPWTVGLARAVQAVGNPVVIADRRFEALAEARRAGVSTLAVEILSVVGEEVADLRDTEQLLAATDDDAYNALVCTRFAPELGRERVHQPALQDSGHRLAPSREWRGKQVIHPDLHHDRLAALTRDGYRFSVAEVEASGELPDAPTDQGWPVLAIGKGGHMTFFSPEHETAVSPGDRVILFKAAERAPPVRRSKVRWRADGPAAPAAALDAGV
jgi:NhaP-type Na+/H+ or K+/H+ antiporter